MPEDAIKYLDQLKELTEEELYDKLNTENLDIVSDEKRFQEAFTQAFRLMKCLFLPINKAKVIEGAENPLSVTLLKRTAASYTIQPVINHLLGPHYAHPGRYHIPGQIRELDIQTAELDMPILALLILNSNLPNEFL